MNPVLAALMIPFLGTALGSAFVFFMKRDMPVMLQKVLLGFASGVMVAASVWSLIIPSVEMSAEQNVIEWLPAAVGFLLGIGFLLLLDSVIPHLHLNSDKPEGVKSRLSKNTMLVLAVTLHNIPEGLTMAISLVGAGESRLKAALTSCLLGLIQPFGALLGLLFIGFGTSFIPYAMAMAGGTLLFVVVNEILPETYGYKQTEKSAFAVFSGFIVMTYLFMVLE